MLSASSPLPVASSGAGLEPRPALRERMRRARLRYRRRLRTTRDGKVFLLLTFGIGIGAINTGNNLLYMLLGAMLAFIVLSGILAEIALRGVEIWRRVPPGLHAGHETTIGIGVRNTKPWLPSFNLAVRESFGKKRLLDPVYFVHLPAGRSDEGGYRCVFPRRGRCRFRGWTLETTFPFGLFVKSREIEGADMALVFPRIDLPLELPRLRGAAGGDGSARRGPGEEFYGLREYRPGDDRRRIYWKGSARRGALVIRETALGAVSAVELVVANVGGQARRDEVFEAALDHAATLAVRLLDAGYAVGLVSFDASLAPATGAEHLRMLLSHLALMRQLAADEVRARGLTLQGWGQGACERVVIETRASQPFRPAGPVSEVVLVEHGSLELLQAAGRTALALDADADAVTLAPAAAPTPAAS